MNALSPGGVLAEENGHMSPPSMLTSAKITIEPTRAANNTENSERSVCLSIVVSTIGDSEADGRPAADRQTTVDSVAVGRRWLDRRMCLSAIRPSERRRGRSRC